jgi:hypothetical protein
MALDPLVGNMSTALDYSAGLMSDLVLKDCVEVMADDIKHGIFQSENHPGL